MLIFGTLTDEGIIEAKLDGAGEMDDLRGECERGAGERGSVGMLFVFEDFGRG